MDGDTTSALDIDAPSGRLVVDLTLKARTEFGLNNNMIETLVKSISFINNFQVSSIKEQIVAGTGKSLEQHAIESTVNTSGEVSKNFGQIVSPSARGGGNSVSAQSVVNTNPGPSGFIVDLFSENIGGGLVEVKGPGVGLGSVWGGPTAKPPRVVQAPRRGSQSRGGNKRSNNALGQGEGNGQSAPKPVGGSGNQGASASNSSSDIGGSSKEGADNQGGQESFRNSSSSEGSPSSQEGSGDKQGDGSPDGSKNDSDSQGSGDEGGLDSKEDSGKESKSDSDKKSKDQDDSESENDESEKDESEKDSEYE